MKMEADVVIVGTGVGGLFQRTESSERSEDHHDYKVRFREQ